MNRLRAGAFRQPLRDLGHAAEAGCVWALLALLRLLPVTTASNIGGRIARLIGPRLPVSRVADSNLRLALPELSASARDAIVRSVWDNLGRTAAEFPHLPKLGPANTGPGWQVTGGEYLQEVSRLGKPVIFVSGHIGNWEVLPVIVARYGLPFASFYRAAANPKVDRMIARLRRDALGQNLPNFPKGAAGARAALRHVAQGGNLGILADQKMNDGIEARFFGHAAMTASAAATFALRHECPIITGRIHRTGSARFELIVDPPIHPVMTGDRIADTAALTQKLNDRIEAAIRAAPGDWLWLHRRWPKNASA